LGNPKHLQEVASQWIYQPREAKDLAVLEPHRIKRVSPLTKISIRWGKGRSQEHYHLSQTLVNAIKKESDGRLSLKIP
jgi:hypothetical protein